MREPPDVSDARVVAGVVTRALREPQETILPGVEAPAVPSGDHVAGAVDYPQTPPGGGAHAPVWQNCGAYDQPVLTERAVHALEHGAVWITYDPVLGGADVRVLRSLARSGTFVRAFAQGPQTPEPEAPCSGDICEPLESAAEPG